jgi:putative glutamine amidotransferase
MARPLIGITVDLDEQKYHAATACPALVSEAGGTPLLLPCLPKAAVEFVSRCDGLILSGGDDPMMEDWAIPTHPRANPLHPQRQAFELAVLAALDVHGEMPVLGICLGMQLMGLHRGGALIQHLPDLLATADQHWPRTSHPVTGDIGCGLVHSHHRQAMADPGSLRVAAVAPDGVIEAIQDDDRPFYLGVQWHPERTEDERLGFALFRRLVEEAGGGGIRQ